MNFITVHVLFALAPVGFAPQTVAAGNAAYENILIHSNFGNGNLVSTASVRR
jgi:hypothetical protein